MPIRDPGTGPSLTADAAGFAHDLATGAAIARLSRPFGEGTAFAVVGAVPAQLAHAGETIVRGAGAAQPGTRYSIKIRASSADGTREVAETLAFDATGAAGQSPYMASATRLAQQYGLHAADANRRYQFHQQYFRQGDWDGTAPVGILNNASLDSSGTLTPNTNAIQIEKAGYIVGGSVNAAGQISGGTFHQVFFGGQPGTLLPGAAALTSWVAHDPGAFTVPAGAHVWFQLAFSLPQAGDRYPGQHGTNSPVAHLGDRFTQGSASQAGHVGAPFTGGGTLPTGGTLGLAAFFTRGCPDPARVVLSIHDSIGVGSAAPIWSYDERGNVGHLHQMMDSAAGGGRLSYWSVGQVGLGTTGANPADKPASGILPWVKAIADHLGNVPFRQISCALGQNDGGTSFAGARGAFDAMVDWCQARFGHQRWVQFEGGMRTTDAGGWRWTDEAAQTPVAGWGAGQTVEQMAAYHSGGAGGRVSHFVPHYTPIRGTSAYRFRTAGLFQSVLAAPHASGPTVQLADAPPVGAHLVFEPGDAANHDPAGGTLYMAKTVTGGGPYAATFVSTGNFNQNVLKPHAAGTAVREALVADGIHFSMNGHALVRDWVIANHKAVAFG